MFEPPVIQELTGGRLHLSQGPIDVVLKAFGPPAAVAEAHRAAARRFPEILPELCAELPALRAPLERADETSHPPVASFGATEWGLARGRFESPVARRMAAACELFADTFVTPMAAVAGAVADELLNAMGKAAPIERAYVNDGGDIAVFCAPGHVLDVGLAGDFAQSPLPALNGTIRVGHGEGIGGIATSGARGRSLSLGIADSVTVLAADAATADVAATLIGNAVNCDSAAIVRRPASSFDPDSDLGERRVTVAVGMLSDVEIDAALAAGLACARRYRSRGLILDAAIMLKGRAVTLGAASREARRMLTGEAVQRSAIGGVRR